MGRFYYFKKKDIQRIESLIANLEQLENEKLDSYYRMRDYHNHVWEYEKNFRQNILNDNKNLDELKEALEKIRNFNTPDFKEKDVDPDYYEKNQKDLRDIKSGLFLLNSLLSKKRDPSRWIFLYFLIPTYGVMLQGTSNEDYDHIFFGMFINFIVVFYWMWKGVD
jgi:hypothetical protein